VRNTNPRKFPLTNILSALLGLTAGMGCSGKAVSGSNTQGPTITPPPSIAAASCSEEFSEEAACDGSPSGQTYYVSTGGDDANDGLSESTPIKTLSRAGNLAVKPGDRVLFRCGDTWRNENLILSRSGADCQNIVYGSYPAVCKNQPIFSGSYPVTDWHQNPNGIWVADLSAGGNAGHFPSGINQLFKSNVRLPLGRWPNRDDPNFPGGYSRIATQSGDSSIGDPNLPQADWTGAIFHHFSIRWLLLNTWVKSSATGTLQLATAIDCYNGCGDPDLSNPADYGWGYFLANHPSTLDQEGEWYYDKTSHQVMLVSSAAPDSIEASVVAAGVKDYEFPSNDDGFHGLIDLGANLTEPIHHVVIENLRLENHWRDGIGTAINLRERENSKVIIRCNTIKDPDSKGINLASWLLGPADWEGGDNITVANNVIDGANHYGIQSFGRNCYFLNNRISNIGLIENLGPSGLGCAFGDSNCASNGDGIALQQFYGGSPAPMSNTVRGNRLRRIGQCGIDSIRISVTAEENVIDEACYSKGDCGGFCTLDAPAISVNRNIIRDVISPSEGFNSMYYERFGFGIYVDGSPGDCTDNTVSGTQGYSLLYQGGAKGNVTGNTLYDVDGRSVLYVATSGVISNLSRNTLVGTQPIRLMFTESDGSVQTSDYNYFIQPYTEKYITMQPGICQRE
jgi:hypothetical protein